MGVLFRTPSKHVWCRSARLFEATGHAGDLHTSPLNLNRNSRLDPDTNSKKIFAVAFGALRAGITAFFLIDAYRQKSDFNRWRFCETEERRARSMAPGLTKRQREVVRLSSLGCTIKEIGSILGVRPATAEHHRTRAMSNLGIHRLSLLALCD